MAASLGTTGVPTTCSELCLAGSELSRTARQQAGLENSAQAPDSWGTDQAGSGLFSDVCRAVKEENWSGGNQTDPEIELQGRTWLEGQRHKLDWD